MLQEPDADMVRMSIRASHCLLLTHLGLPAMSMSGRYRGKSRHSKIDVIDPEPAIRSVQTLQILFTRWCDKHFAIDHDCVACEERRPQRVYNTIFEDVALHDVYHVCSFSTTFSAGAQKRMGYSLYARITPSLRSSTVPPA